MYQNPPEQHSKIRTVVLVFWVSRPTRNPALRVEIHRTRVEIHRTSLAKCRKSTEPDLGNAGNPQNQTHGCSEIHRTRDVQTSNSVDFEPRFCGFSTPFPRFCGFSTPRNVAKSTEPDPVLWILNPGSVDFGSSDSRFCGFWVWFCGFPTKA